MNMDFKRKLAIPMEVKEMYPLTGNIGKIKEERDAEIQSIFTGKSNKMILIIGPCSADREDSVLDYVERSTGKSQGQDPDHPEDLHQ